MAKLVMTAKEKRTATYLEWDDASLGRAVKKLAIDIKDGHGGDALCCSACATLLACMVAQRNKSKAIIGLNGVHDDNQEYGDWQIVISRGNPQAEASV